MSKYNDIINYNYVMKHERMSIKNRAFQFAPFSALTGYNELIKETGRETVCEKEINQDSKEILDYKINIIKNKLDIHPVINIIYFVKDSKKSGGKYETISDYIKKIDMYNKLIIMENGLKIKISDIIEINSLDVNIDDIM